MEEELAADRVAEGVVLRPGMAVALPGGVGEDGQVAALPLAERDPAASEKLGPIAFKGSVRRLNGRWLVDSVVPAAIFSRDGEKPKVFANTDFQRGTLGAGGDGAKLSASWLLVPAGLLGLCVLFPIGLLLRRKR